MKLSEQILLAAIAFFGMEAGSTETEVHQKMSESKPLADLVKEAAGAVVDKLTEQVNTLTEQVKALTEKHDLAVEASKKQLAEAETLRADLAKANEATGAAIAEKEAKIAEHAASVQTLSGEIAKLKAGNNLDAKEIDGGHEGGQGGGSSTKKPIAVESTSLKGLLTPRATN